MYTYVQSRQRIGLKRKKVKMFHRLNASFWGGFFFGGGGILTSAMFAQSRLCSAFSKGKFVCKLYASSVLCVALRYGILDKKLFVFHLI